MQSAFARQALNRNPQKQQPQRRQQQQQAKTTRRSNGSGAVVGGAMRQSTTKASAVANKQLQQQQTKKTQQQLQQPVVQKNHSSSRSVTFAPHPPASPQQRAAPKLLPPPYFATQQPSPVQYVAFQNHDQFAPQEFSQLTEVSQGSSSSFMSCGVPSRNHQQQQQLYYQQQQQLQQVPLHQPGWSSNSGGTNGMSSCIGSFARSASASCNSFGMHRPGGGAATSGQMSASAASFRPFSINDGGSGCNSVQYPSHASAFSNSHNSFAISQQQSRTAQTWQNMQNMKNAAAAPHANHRPAASTTPTRRRTLRLDVAPSVSSHRTAAVLVARQQQQRANAAPSATSSTFVQQHPSASQSACRNHHHALGTHKAPLSVARSSINNMPTPAAAAAAANLLLPQPSTAKTPTKTIPQQQLRTYVESLVDTKVSEEVPALFNAKKKELDGSICAIVSGQVDALFDAKNKELDDSISSVNKDLEAKKKELQDNMSVASGQFAALVDSKTKELDENLSNVSGQVTALLGVKKELETLLSGTVQELHARATELKELHLEELDNKATTVMKTIKDAETGALEKVVGATETAVSRIFDTGATWIAKIIKTFSSSTRSHTQEGESQQSLATSKTTGGRTASSNSSTMVSPPVREISKKKDGKTTQTTTAVTKSKTNYKMSSNSSAFVSPPARKQGEQLQSSTATGKVRPPKTITTVGVKAKTVKKKKNEVKPKTNTKAGVQSKKPKKVALEDADAAFRDIVNLGPAPRTSSRGNKKRAMDDDSPLPINNKKGRIIMTPAKNSAPKPVRLPAKATSQPPGISRNVAKATAKSGHAQPKSRATFGRTLQYASVDWDSDNVRY
jgi:hypothetical protein